MAQIVLAEDQPLMLQGVAAHLTAAGHRILRRPTCAAGIIMAARNCPADALLLVSPMIPDVFDALRLIREKLNDYRPIILHVAQGTDEVLRSAIRLKVDGIVLKTSNPMKLLACVATVASAGRYIDRRVGLRVAQLSAGAMVRNLSVREQQIVDLVRQGFPNAEIARRLGLREGTVKVYLSKLFDKIGVRNRIELALTTGNSLI